MPPKTQQKSKAQKAMAASASKNKKKKWSKGKNRDKVALQVLMDADTFERMGKEVPKMKMVTPSTLSERLKINLSLARQAIKTLEAEGKIRPVLKSSKQLIYTRATNA